MLLRVARTRMLTPTIRAIRLEAPDLSALPPGAAGCHVELQLPIDGPAASRKYSLVSDLAERRHYEIAVKRNPHGRGGSIYLHDVLSVGDELEVSPPVDGFGIAPEGTRHLLIAGGIGITPMLGLASRLHALGQAFELHYAAKNAAEMAFRDEVLAFGPARVRCHFTGGADASRIEPRELLAPLAADSRAHVYVCGPARLIDAVRLAAQAAGMPKARVHFESFGPAWDITDGPVRLKLTASDIEVAVQPGTTLLEAIESAGAWIPSDCRRGECGACIASYSAGTAIHRDNCLSVAQRSHSFCPCVSWASADDVFSVAL